jgi:acetyl-CoA acetyltransferase
MMHEFGVTEDDFTAIAVQCQNWAIHHPYAAKAYLGPFTAEKVNQSPMVSWPLRMLHMAPWGPPGTGGAFIVTSSERARSLNDHPIYILGAGECETHEYVTDRMALRTSPVDLGVLPNLTSTGCAVAARTAYEMAGLGPKDMDTAQLSSNFAHIEMLMLAELGFCDKHEMGAFVRSGVLDVGGDLPTNTNGGWLSFGQAGAACAQDTVIEAVRQLRGMALGKQIKPNPSTAVVHGLGGISACHSVLVLSKAH